MAYLSHANYLVVPRSTTESWEYLPVCFTNKINAGSYWSIVPETHLYQFGILNSAMHMAWIKCVSGKLQCYDRVHFNPSITNFPWPISHTQVQIVDIEAKALSILQIRTQFQDIPLTELYHPALMPLELRNAHAELDKAVDMAYSHTTFTSENSRIGFLLSFQRKIASLIGTFDEKITRIPQTALYPEISTHKLTAMASLDAVF